MSVINKMLRDLDARRTVTQPGHGTGVGGNARGAKMTLQGTLAQAAPMLSQRPWLLMVLAVLSLLVVAPFGLGTSERVVHWALDVAPQVSTVAPAPEVGVSLTEVSPRQEPPIEAPQIPGQPLHKPPVHEPQEEVLEATRTHRKPPWPVPQALMLKLSAQMPMRMPKQGYVAEPVAASPQAVDSAATSPSTPQLAPPTPSGPHSAPTPIQVNRQPAIQENLQQAQQLWHAGSRDAALVLLRSTLQAAEQGDMGSADAQAVLREWARMALAQDRAAEVMPVIQRHAAHLAQQPETWALQGQAAQRLGLHAEAIDAYTHALNLRPYEVRWLLASAVSMAAAGQTEQAARLVAKARAQGPINPQIAAYLKQAGVAVP